VTAISAQGDLEVELLNPETTGAYLLARGLTAPAEPVEVVELGGGVSNVVLAVTSGRLRAVVKQSLDKLRVTDDWYAKRERIITEARALQLAGRMRPASVPQVIDVDPERGIIVIDRAPDGWTNFKEELLQGRADASVAARCGEILAAWHSGTWRSDEVRASFDDLEAFDQLRVDPYYRTVAGRIPEVRPFISSYTSQMSTNRKALVHGDFSPKNVLHGTGDLWIVDFEVAHFGDPAFDLAFMLNHLMLKAIHSPRWSSRYELCAGEFWNSYRHSLTISEDPDAAYVLGHLGCLMLARVHGKSPAEYLTDPGRIHARTLGTSLAKDPPPSLEEAWARLERTAP
jgi:tRNA A-37 threonylcarbamoyl transferase component Bud32